jgi:hypothetical protein
LPKIPLDRYCALPAIGHSVRKHRGKDYFPIEYLSTLPMLIRAYIQMRMQMPPERRVTRIPDQIRPALAPVARRVFWWGNSDEWLDDATRFAAQVMTFGDWDDTALVTKLLGDSIFQEVLTDPPPGVFDVKSWSYWHHRYQLDVPPLPSRNF